MSCHSWFYVCTQIDMNEEGDSFNDAAEADEDMAMDLVSKITSMMGEKELPEDEEDDGDFAPIDDDDEDSYENDVEMVLVLCAERISTFPSLPCQRFQFTLLFNSLIIDFLHLSSLQHRSS